MSEAICERPPVKLLVIEASGIIDIDYTGAKILQQAVADLRAQGIVIAIARLSERRAQDQAGRSGLVEAIGADHVFLSVEDAVRKLGPNRSPP